jgi:chemotaxis protein MotB
MRTVQWMLLASLVAGCGYKQEIAALEAELAAVRGAVGERDADLADRATTIAGLENDAAALNAKLVAAREALADLEAELDGEREKAARILADRGSLRDEVASMKEAIAELAERKRQADARVSSYRELVDRFRSLIDAGTLDVRIVDGRMVVVLKTDILFASGSADLSDEGGAALTAVGEVLGTLEGRRFQVEGHTDDVPISTRQYPSNWYLAAARSIGVMQYLIEGGLSSEAVSAASFGEMHPVAPNKTDEGRALNRRIEIVLVPDLTDLPGYDELTKL